MIEVATVAAYTGLRREAGQWVIYFRGRVVGECGLFSKAQATLAQITAAEAQPVQDTVATVQTPQAVSAPKRVSILCIGRRDFPGSRIVRDERLEAVAVDDGQPRPPRQPVTLTAALDWLERQGFEPESMTSTGMANWISLSGGTGNVVARRKCVFVRPAPAGPGRAA
jgi:hypothetical protein